MNSIETSLLISQNDSFGKNWGPKNLGKLLRILQNVIEKINWRVLPLDIHTYFRYTLYIVHFKLRKKLC
jgi:hypothetical protein